MSSRDLTTPSVSPITTDFRHLAIYCLASLTSIIAPKSYSTKVPSFLIPMFPAWGSAWTRPMSIVMYMYNSNRRLASISLGYAAVIFLEGTYSEIMYVSPAS
ncbi:hypothetical protein PBCV1_a446R [Paramecium bursaria Chlorella virus 1]|uniref:Uncharacterized protein n=1 Tax=Paramecium bursaria Chlorella virus 1 TaxID=10506 RepID=Q98497_PBCV1|nr:hypothetical protein PBCV1_a446R [Paramecium bursaria Chlorella virus 1]AAC96814.2 hypothetical protein [Paramecium bursaria Chlorella virus 1]